MLGMVFSSGPRLLFRLERLLCLVEGWRTGHYQLVYWARRCGSGGLQQLPADYRDLHFRRRVGVAEPAVPIGGGVGDSRTVADQFIRVLALHMDPLRRIDRPAPGANADDRPPTTGAVRHLDAALAAFTGALLHGMADSAHKDHLPRASDCVEIQFSQRSRRIRRAQPSPA